MLNKTMINTRLDKLLNDHPQHTTLIRLLKHEIHTGSYDVNLELEEIKKALEYGQEFHQKHGTESANIRWALEHIEDLKVLK